jgi:1-deoxy-D-xylulose-5-phosphate reductoisomerase
LSGAVFNAAKERALDGFIAKRIGFQQIATVVEEVLSRISANPGHIDAAITLDNVIELDHLARVRADEIMNELEG